MNALTTKNPNEILNSVEPEIYLALKNSIYPGAKDESIAMVLTYCKAANLNPVLKPVHIVPMWIVDKKTGKGEMRDIIMPGINHYRIQASRSGCAGVSEPEFGEEITETLDGISITYPRWCKIIVKRIIARQVVEFVAKEFWKENYATGGKDKETGKKKISPNEVWQKRPYAQLAKCTESQAYRKAFPEICSLPTAEEMEGKIIDADEAAQLEKASVPQNKGISALKEKLDISEAQEVSPEPDFAEVDEEMPFVTVEDVKTEIESAKTLEELVKTRRFAKHLSDEEKKQMNTFYKKKEKELKV